MSLLAIDEAFDAGLANELARLESYNKHLYRPNTYLHKWWARRCGSTFRLLLKHLVADPARRDYYTAGGLEGKIVLDPMMGGGTTIHEAIRLGANVIGVDIDPIPVLQARAALSGVPLARLEAAFTAFWQALAAGLAPAFQTACPRCGRPAPLRFMLYGLRRHCACGPALFVDSLALRQAKGATVRLCPACHAVDDGPAAAGCTHDQRPGWPIYEKGVRHCPRCGAPFADELATPFYARYTPLVVAGHCSDHGPFFTVPTPADLALLASAGEQRAGLDFGSALPVEPGPKSADLVRRGIRSYLDLFSSRQLLYLRQALAHLPGDDAAVRLYLALLVSTSLEFNSMLCGYKGGGQHRPGAIRHTFSLHAYSFPYTALENNPLYPRPASGTLLKLFHDRVERARRWAASPHERALAPAGPRLVAIAGEQDLGVEVSRPAGLQFGTRRFLLRQGSAAALDLPDGSVDYVVTDPPYFDSVQYSDLAAFFRVWLRLLLPAGSQAGICWEYDTAGSAVDPQANGRGPLVDGQYVQVISAIFAECHRVLRQASGRLIFTFHHWNPRGWAAVTLALKRAGFLLVNYYVVHSENPISVHIANFKALTHDAILVLAPTEADIHRSWNRPAAVDTADSHRFCQGCAQLLGWMLAAGLAEEEVEKVWVEVLS